jgi:hypothetical protein
MDNPHESGEIKYGLRKEEGEEEEEESGSGKGRFRG